MAGFRLTTKVQVSGWRFLLRRVEHAIVRRDTRMFDDPLQFYSRAVSAGIIIAVLICLGAATSNRSGSAAGTAFWSTAPPISFTSCCPTPASCAPSTTSPRRD